MDDRGTFLAVNMVMNARKAGREFGAALAEQAATLVFRSDLLAEELVNKGQMKQEDLRIFRERFVERLMTYINQTPA